MSPIGPELISDTDNNTNYEEYINYISTLQDPWINVSEKSKDEFSDNEKSYLELENIMEDYHTKTELVEIPDLLDFRKK